jgi:nitroreductase/ubiquinone/menaquinone biosynthesis C-methylase UbiE
MDFEKLISERKSTRNFNKLKIDRDIVCKMIEDAIEAPTSCNLQHFSFILIDKDELITQLRKEVTYKFNYSGTFLLMLMQKHLSVNRSAGYTSAGFIADHLILSAKNKGYDSLVMAGFGNDKKLKKVLRIPSSYEILMLIALGKSTDIVENKPKRIEVNRWVGLNVFNSSNLLKTDKHPKQWSWQEIVDYRTRIGQVYIDRQRLNSLSFEAYQIVVKNHSARLVNSRRNPKILDLISYDGIWAKLMSEAFEASGNSHKIVLADFIEPVLYSLKRQLNIDTILLRNFDPNNLKHRFDFLTSIFQFNHFANIDEQLEFCRRVLFPNGGILIATYRDSSIKLILRVLIELTRRFQGRSINVYENSIHYKAGPYQRVSNRYLARTLKKHGFSILSVDTYTIGTGFRKYLISVFEGQKL